LLYGRRYQSEAEFQRESFREYSNYLNCVGIDFTYYNWPMASQMVTLAHQAPRDFRFTLKVTDKIVTQKFPNLPRYGRFAGKENPQFLDPQAYLDFFWQPLEPLAEKIGLVIFEFPHLNLSNLDRLDTFFSAIPRGIPIALELRSRELFGREFYQWLLDRGVCPAMNSWTRMPPLETQWRVLRSLALPNGMPLVVRATLPPGREYEEANQALAPFNSLHTELSGFPECVLDIAELATNEKREAFILVGNLLEGSAPLSLARIAVALGRLNDGSAGTYFRDLI
jgi:uncharacterized protein YecE (DUF72 family)